MPFEFIALACTNLNSKSQYPNVHVFIAKYLHFHKYLSRKHSILYQSSINIDNFAVYQLVLVLLLVCHLLTIKPEAIVLFYYLTRLVKILVL